MPSAAEKDYLVIVQCHLVKERCSGFHCEKAFHDRSGGFTNYSAQQSLRLLTMTCGGCCGRSLQRKLINLLHLSHKREQMDRSRIMVHLSTCITKASHHGPVCPHLDYLKELISRLNLDIARDTWISKTAEKRRQQGLYPGDPP
ncbi:CGGC domain-containing protein [Desulfuromonas acetoxidans]|nr:CGGC domain-containing protein [Desulfuromonas acetoxidans]NVD23896.1 CGGC domain-containing protein [Desulfuromonas acetoxidans]NVE16193.1 CGGC domain-containing protein [Desulfuromonas acetoxidans]